MSAHLRRYVLPATSPAAATRGPTKHFARVGLRRRCPSPAGCGPAPVSPRLPAGAREAACVGAYNPGEVQRAAEGDFGCGLPSIKTLTTLQHVLRATRVKGRDAKSRTQVAEAQSGALSSSRAPKRTAPCKLWTSRGPLLVRTWCPKPTRAGHPRGLRTTVASWIGALHRGPACWRQTCFLYLWFYFYILYLEFLLFFILFDIHIFTGIDFALLRESYLLIKVCLKVCPCVYLVSPFPSLCCRPSYVRR